MMRVSIRSFLLVRSILWVLAFGAGLFAASTGRSGVALLVLFVLVADIGRTVARITAPRSFARPRPHARTIPQDVKVAVAVRDGGKCRVCGSTKDLQYDHIYPWSLGGRSDDPDNIQLLCGYHNRLKSNR